MTARTYIRVRVKEQVFAAMNSFTHVESKTCSRDPKLELELELAQLQRSLLHCPLPLVHCCSDGSSTMAAAQQMPATSGKTARPTTLAECCCAACARASCCAAAFFCQSFWHDKHWQRHTLWCSQCQVLGIKKWTILHHRSGCRKEGKKKRGFRIGRQKLTPKHLNESSYQVLKP